MFTLFAKKQPLGVRFFMSCDCESNDAIQDERHGIMIFKLEVPLYAHPEGLLTQEIWRSVLSKRVSFFNKNSNQFPSFLHDFLVFFSRLAFLD